MVADLVAHSGDLADDTGIEMPRKEAEIVGSADPFFMLDLCHFQRISVARLHVVAEDYAAGSRIFEESGVGLERVSLRGKGFKEGAVYLYSEVRGCYC